MEGSVWGKLTWARSMGAAERKMDLAESILAEVFSRQGLQVMTVEKKKMAPRRLKDG